MSQFTVTCPHCHALLELDGERQVVVSAKPAEKPRSTASMEDRLKALQAEREAADAKLAEAMRAEKAGAELREEKFRKLLQQAGDGPVEKPIRDIDLD
jgi:uncharacterized Zn finger protein (UPF0148 family)